MATVWFWLVLYISVGGMPLKILEAGWNHWKYFSDSIDAHYVIRITKDPAWRAMQLWKPLLTLQGLDRLNVFVLCIYIDPTLIQQDITQDQSCMILRWCEFSVQDGAACSFAELPWADCCPDLGDLGDLGWRPCGEMLRYTDEEYPDTNALVRHRGCGNPNHDHFMPTPYPDSLARNSVHVVLLIVQMHAARSLIRNWSIYLFPGGSPQNARQTHQTFAWEEL